MLQDQQERYGLEMKARLLSKKVWDLLMLLPTNPHMLSMFQQLNTQVCGFKFAFFLNILAT